MDNDQALIDALAAAGVAVPNGMAVADLCAACRAYHKAMIVVTPGLCVHEPDGTVRAATVRDCEDASRTAWVRWQVRNHREGTP